MSPRLRPSVLRRRGAVHERGDHREELAQPVVVEAPHGRVLGSALREPSPDEVYEGRLQGAHRTEPLVGVNWLDVDEAAAVRTWTPVDGPVDVPEGVGQGWVPWCPVCLVEPIKAGPLGEAEYLARQHDIVHHGGAWSARAVPAGDVARLLAPCGVEGGAEGGAERRGGVR